MVKRTTVFFLILSFVSVIVTNAQQEEKSLSLEECILIAAENNLGVLLRS